MNTGDFWRGRRVLVTGHTGFKGSWLCLWLQSLGAELSGVALPPDRDRALYTMAGVGDGMRSYHCDIRDAAALARIVAEVEPECVLHLAAQALVRASYADPAGTYATNVMGTVHVLEAVRATPSVRAVVVVSSDKCYENREWLWGYRENDAMGGHDPYSSSKGCTELVCSAWAHSFFGAGSATRLASARAGNVIGGGDWARDRLLPDLVAAFASGEPVRLRYPQAVRPWQHVLEPLGGYLVLARHLLEGAGVHGEGWNFGPAETDARPVAEVVERAARLWGEGAGWQLEPVAQPAEAGLLRLDCTRARTRLGWAPRLSLETALAWTIEWYRSWLAGGDVAALTRAQIRQYEELAR